MPLGALYCLALSLLLVVSAVARADDVTNHVDLVCNAAANLALVRFSISADATPTYPRLPQALDQGLSAGTGSDRTDCALANRDDADLRSRLPEESRQGAEAWAFLAMPDPDAALRHDVGLVQACPLLPAGVHVEGWRYHVDTGVVEQVLTP